MDRARELCEQCGFDSDLYNDADTISSMSVIGPILAASIEGLDDDVLQMRPDESTWSIAEYLDHLRGSAATSWLVTESAASSPGTELGDLRSVGIRPAQQTVDVAAAIEGIALGFNRNGDALAALESEQWNLTAGIAGNQYSIAWFSRHMLHDALHHLVDIGRIRHRLGHGAATQSGTVVQLSTSAGGVPKLPVDGVMVTASGVEGDVQNNRRHHGRPIQAVCLWSADVVDALNADGHPIAYGNAGENITIAGVDWATLLPGSRLDVGSVPMWVTAHAIPCAKNAQWFSDRDFNRILHSNNPGLSRLYAVPLGAGTITNGDDVVVEP